VSQSESPSVDRNIIDVEWTAAAAPAEDPGRQRQTALTVRLGTGSALARREPSVVLEEAELPSSLDARLVVLSEPSSARARSYQLLQHRLLALSDPRVISVTSAWPGEGKTTCAANLALTLADEAFARVLLIEANVRRPALAQAFGFDPEDSFMDRLVRNGDAASPYLVAAIRGSRLHVAALRLDISKALRVDRLLLGLAISQLRCSYDYIVIDSASLFESADADVAGECADGVIVTARAAKSRRNGLRRAVQQLSPANVLGVVLLDA
jgi:Mrp family chromosome partitioning ATPase